MYTGRFTYTVPLCMCLRAPAYRYACACTRDASGIHSKQNNRAHPLRICWYTCTYTRTRMNLYAYILQVNRLCDNIVFVGFN